MSQRDIFNEVYSQDQQPKSRGWIQWKGTDVCMDVYCVCGQHCHVDGDFVYAYQCPACKRVFAVGQNVKLIELSAEQINGLGYNVVQGRADE